MHFEDCPEKSFLAFPPNKVDRNRLDICDTDVL